LKKRRTVLLRPHAKPRKIKTDRRVRREQKAKLTLFGVAVAAFFVTLIVLVVMFVRPEGLVSPLGALERKAVLAEAKKANQDTKKIQSYLKKEKIAYATIDRLSDSSYSVSLKSGEKVYLSDDKDILKQLTSLQLILARLTMEGKQALRLDFRYDKPVVVLK
jgi:hypothetical protein